MHQRPILLQSPHLIKSHNLLSSRRFRPGIGARGGFTGAPYAEICVLARSRRVGFCKSAKRTAPPESRGAASFACAFQRVRFLTLVVTRFQVFALRQSGNLLSHSSKHEIESLNATAFQVRICFTPSPLQRPLANTKPIAWELPPPTVSNEVRHARASTSLRARCRPTEAPSQ